MTHGLDDLDEAGDTGGRVEVPMLGLVDVSRQNSVSAVVARQPPGARPRTP